MSMTYKTICISSGCSLQVPYNWEIIIKQDNGMNLFTTTQHQKVLTAQKVTSKELYWILITTTDH